MTLFEGELLCQLELIFDTTGALEIYKMLDNPPQRLTEPMYLSIQIRGRDLHQQMRDRVSRISFLRRILRAA